MSTPVPAKKRPIALVVEDDPGLQRAVNAQLHRMGFDVRAALHYDAAIAHLNGAPPQLALIDLELPTESGYEVCEYMRDELGLIEVPILVTSDSASPEAMAYAEKAGANAFLRKPFLMSELTRYIKALLEKKKRSEPRIWRLRP